LAALSCGGSSTSAGDDAGPDGGGGGGGNLEESDPLYDPDALPTFELDIPDSTRDALFADPGLYQPATFRYGDLTLEVGIHLKGSASFRDLDGKAAFKIKFDEYVVGQRFFGLRRLTLNNSTQDPSMLAERIGFRFYRAAGAIAPRCNSARVVVNGEYWGLYANVETIDDEFAEARWDDAPGNLYDINAYFVDVTPGSEDGYDQETNEDVPDKSDLTALIEAANGPADTFLEDVATRLDVRETLAVGGAQAIIADWDGYFGAINNYKLYHELDSDRFVLIPYGIDQTFGDVSYDVYGSDSNRNNSWLFVQCKNDGDCLAEYQEAVANALAVWESLPLEAELDAWYAQIRDSAYEDPRKEVSNAEFDADVDRVRQFIRDRAADVHAQLDGPLPELCENGIDDDGNGRTDCNDPECDGVCR